MIRIGIAGYGYWGPNLARVVAETGAAKVEMIADRASEALARAGLRHPVARLTPDIGAVISDPNVDAVIIATPVSTHYELALAALMAGKHVLVEKPLTDDAATSARLVDAAARCRRTLMVDHTFVYTPAVQAIAGLAASGDLGTIYYYDSTRVNLGLFQRDVNVIWDLAVHDFAILDALLNAAPVAISASAASFLDGSPENMAHLVVHYDDGTIAHLNVNWLAPVKIRQTLIGGSRKMVVYDDLQPSEKVKVYDRGADLADDPLERRISYRLGDMWAPALSARETLAGVVQEFVRAITTGSPPLTSGESGLRVVEMLVAASRSCSRRGQPIDLSTLKVAS